MPVDSGMYIYIDGLFVLRPIAVILLEQHINVHAFFRSRKLFGKVNGLTAFCLCEEHLFVERSQVQMSYIIPKRNIKESE